MILSTLGVITIVAIIGLITKFIVDKSNIPYEVTWLEYAIVMLVISFIAAPGSMYLGWKMWDAF